jgi:flagellin-like hook-associated protein FlgL
MRRHQWATLCTLLAALSLIALTASGCTDEEETISADVSGDATSADTSGSTSADTSGSTSADVTGSDASTSGTTSTDTSGGTTSADTSGTVQDTNVPVDTITNLDTTPDTADVDPDTADVDPDTADVDPDTADVDPDTADVDPDTDTETDVDDADVPPGPTYTNDIQAIYQANCSSCHTRQTGCSGGVCFGAFYTESQRASNVCAGLTVAECTLIRIENGSMPLGGGIVSAADRALIQEWINAGMPE